MNVLKRVISFLTAAIMCTTALAVSIPVQASEETTEPSVQTDANMEIEGSNTLGNLLVQAVEESTEETGNSTEEEHFDSYISSIDMEYGYAYVRFTSVSDSTLVVALYDEATGQMLTSSSVAVAAGDADASLEFDVMPEDYFIVKGYLVNTVDFAPMSKVFENTMYTQSKQEFYAKTPEDFDSERVLMFDETSADNFAVFDESATLVQYSAGTNIVAVNDPSTGTYVIENADGTIQNLSSGEVLVLYYGDDLPLMVKVDTITVDGSAVTIIAGDIALSDVFEFFRLDTGYCEPDYENAELAEGVTVETNTELTDVVTEDTITEEASYAAITTGIVGAGDEGFDLDNGTTTTATTADKDISVSSSIKFSLDGDGNNVSTYNNDLSIDLAKKNLDKFKSARYYDNLGDGNSATLEGKTTASGKVTCGIKASLVVNFDKMMAGNGMLVEFALSSKLTTDVSISSVMSVDIPLLPKEVEIPLRAGFKVCVNPVIHLETNAKIDINTYYEKTLGFSYDENRENKLEEIRDKDTAGFNFKIDGSIYFGVNLHPSVEWVHESIFCMDIEQFGGGILITGSLVNISETVTKEEIMEYPHDMNSDGASTGGRGGGSAWLDNDDVIVDSSLLDEETEKHMCMACIDGEIVVQFKIKLQLKILEFILNDDGEEEEKEKNIFPSIEPVLPDIHLGYFYINLMDSEGNMCFKADWGKCPNKAFLCDVACRDDDTGSAVENAAVTITDSSGNSASGQTDSKGKIKAWLTLGTYKVSAEADGYEDITEMPYDLTYCSVHNENENKINDEKYELFVNDLSGQKLEVDMTILKHNITATIVDEEGNEIEGATTICSYTSKVALHEGLDTVVITGGAVSSIALTTAKALFKKMTGDYPEIITKLSPSSTLYRLPDGTHTFTVACPGYGVQKFEVTVDGADKDVKFVLDDGIYNISVSVVDSDGDPIESALVTSSCTDLTESIKTNSNGCAVFQGKNGEYMFTAEKDRYKTAEQKVVVDGNHVDVEFVLEEQEITWQYLYREKLLSLLDEGIVGSGPYRFDLVYINEDDIPELVISSGYANPDYSMIFAIADDQVVNPCGDGETVGAYGLFSYLYKEGIFIGPNRFGLSIYQYDGTLLYSLSDTTGLNPNYGKITINGEDATPEEFREIYDRYTKSDSCKDASFPYTIDEETILEVLADPVDEQLSVASSYESNQLTQNIAADNNSTLLTASITAGENTANFTSITPNTIYNLYCMKSNESETPFSTDNLLYMSQIVSDADGNLNISFIPTEAYDDGDVFVVSPTGEVIVYGEEAEETMEAVNLTMLQSLQLDSEATLISSDPSVVTIDESGKARAVGEGYAAVFSLTDASAELLTVIVVTEPDYMIGDVNGDDTVNLDDASIVLTIYAGNAAGLTLDSFTDEQLSIADVDSDGVIGLSDATAILSYYAQKSAGLEPTWDMILAV